MSCFFPLRFFQKLSFAMVRFPENLRNTYTTQEGFWAWGVSIKWGCIQTQALKAAELTHSLTWRGSVGEANNASDLTLNGLAF